MGLGGRCVWCYGRRDSGRVGRLFQSNGAWYKQVRWPEDLTSLKTNESSIGRRTELARWNIQLDEIREIRIKGLGSFNALKVMIIILFWMRDSTGSQCRARRIGDLWSVLAERQMKRTAVLKITDQVFGTLIAKWSTVINKRQNEITDAFWEHRY